MATVHILWTPQQYPSQRLRNLRSQYRRTKVETFEQTSLVKKICEDLTKPHLQARLAIPQLKRNVRSKIEEILGGECHGRRMTRFSCFQCKRFDCFEHQAKLCVRCAELRT